MHDKRVFLATEIELGQARDLGPKFYVGQAFELSPLVAVNVGVVDVICAHDLVKFFVLESVLPTLEFESEYPRCVIASIGGEEFDCGLLVGGIRWWWWSADEASLFRRQKTTARECRRRVMPTCGWRRKWWEAEETGWRRKMCAVAFGDAWLVAPTGGVDSSGGDVCSEKKVVGGDVRC
ncbi:unnamed protein product [Lactuca saligna]|uniref:Uncharacterized protein n=1 Tax=Lactuca saligna TaxID=75948 RepID=A0AA36E1P6_LACSI|nr:unnamed protein product [Lactuca saligna]